MADDGSVFVFLPDGTERLVGQWAAGDPAEGLAHYQRRYNEIVSTVALTTGRLATGSAAPDEALAVVKKVRAGLAEPNFVGDIAALEASLTGLEDAAERRRLALAEQRKAAREQTLARRVAIADEAEQLGPSQQWKATTERFRQLLEEWKALPRFDKHAEQQQWERFSAARSAFDKARRQHYAELDATRSAGVTAKRDLIRRAEALSTSTDWGPTSRAYRDLMAEWKSAPRAGRNDDEKLWQQFRAAQDVFFTARAAHDNERNAGESANLEAKRAVLAKAEALLPATDFRAARGALSELMDEWDAIGHVPRADKPGLERRLRAVETALRNAERDHWRRTDPAARDRAERTVESFRAALTKQQKRLAQAQESGDAAKIADAEGSVAASQELLDAAERTLADYTR